MVLRNQDDPVGGASCRLTILGDDGLLGKSKKDPALGGGLRRQGDEPLVLSPEAELVAVELEVRMLHLDHVVEQPFNRRSRGDADAQDVIHGRAIGEAGHSNNVTQLGDGHLGAQGRERESWAARAVFIAEKVM